MVLFMIEYGIDFLSLSALILSIVNGTFLLSNHLKDKPKFKVEPVYPNVYQWWFELPPVKKEGKKTKKYGFLSYVKVKNSGLRKSSLSLWQLSLKHKNSKEYICEPISIPEPIIQMGDSEHEKPLPVLGQGGIYYSPDTVVDSGTSTSGVCYYIVEYSNDIKNSIKIKDDKIEGRIVIKDIFDNETSTKINFKKKKLNFLMDNIKNINDIISVDKSSQKYS